MQSPAGSPSREAPERDRLGDTIREINTPPTKSYQDNISGIVLHQFQQTAVEQVEGELAAGPAKILVVAPTGIEQRAIVEIEKQCIEAQTQLAVAGLTSESALAFVARLPTVKTLMPALSFEAIAGEADPPLVEQLVSPNALRQRHYRERHRNVSQALQPPSRNPLHNEEDGSNGGCAP
jgi:hypothetical protein